MKREFNKKTWDEIAVVCTGVSASCWCDVMNRVLMVKVVDSEVPCTPSDKDLNNKWRITANFINFITITAQVAKLSSAS